MPKLKHQETIDRMSLEEKVQLCSGAGFWTNKAFEKHGIPTIMMTDGPHGLRKVADDGDRPGADQTVPATCFPPACASACSWDRDLLQEMGAAIAEEALQEGVSIVLGPGVNIKRNPLCGRNFEYFSEDPFLAGVMAEYWIKGAQGKGVGVSLKHFAANNQETRRTTSDSVVDERTLREIYLAAFEIAVRNARPATIMCAYNKLNGTYCSDSTFLLRKVLRDEWGFEGVVVSDWGAVNDRVEGFKAGLDLEMPSSGGFFDREVIEAVKSGALPEERVDESVDRLLALIFSGHQNRREDYRYDVEAHHELAKKVAVGSAVLLKNEEHILPLGRRQKIALIGALASEPRFQGAGSSWINPTRLPNAIDGFDAQGLTFTYYPGYSLTGSRDDRLLQGAVDGASQAEVAVVFAGLPPAYESEGFDRHDMKLPPWQDELIERVTAANPDTVVVLTAGAPVQMPWEPKVKAVLNMYLPGQAGGLAAAELLVGTANPGGKLAETYPISYGEVPSAGFYEEGGRQAQYREGIYVGYRYYETAGKEVRFPFGHGLSYTTFEYHSLKVSPARPVMPSEVHVSFTLKNTGPVDGAEVAQVYISALESPIFRPWKELKQFARLFLKPGKSQRVSITLDSRAFAIYEAKIGSWVVPGGKYRISVGSSSRDIRLTGEIILRGEQLQSGSTIPSDWYTSLRGKPTQADLESLLGHPIVLPIEPSRGGYSLSSSLRDMQKSVVARRMLKLLEKRISREFGGAPESDPNFRGVMEMVATNPLKHLVISSGGLFSLTTAQVLIDMANGHYLKGLRSLLQKKK